MSSTTETSNPKERKTPPSEADDADTAIIHDVFHNKDIVVGQILPFVGIGNHASVAGIDRQFRGYYKDFASAIDNPPSVRVVMFPRGPDDTNTRPATEFDTFGKKPAEERIMIQYTVNIAGQGLGGFELAKKKGNSQRGNFLRHLMYTAVEEPEYCFPAPRNGGRSVTFSDTVAVRTHDFDDEDEYAEKNECHVEVKRNFNRNYDEMDEEIGGIPDHYRRRLGFTPSAWLPDPRAYPKSERNKQRGSTTTPTTTAGNPAAVDPFFSIGGPVASESFFGKSLNSAPPLTPSLPSKQSTPAEDNEFQDNEETSSGNDNDGDDKKSSNSNSE